jgi:aldehyde:ferredoxin oxidoreductase
VDKYDGLLQHYYDQRGYDNRGIPTKATLSKVGLDAEAAHAERFATLT